MDAEAERDREAMRYTSSSLLDALPAGWYVDSAALLEVRVTGLPKVVAKYSSTEYRAAYLQYVFNPKLSPAPKQRHTFMVFCRGKRCGPAHPFDTPQAAIAYWELTRGAQ